MCKNKKLFHVKQFKKTDFYPSFYARLSMAYLIFLF